LFNAALMQGLNGRRTTMPPSVYIVGGPNGAGKTTFAREFLPRYAHCQVFINADDIRQRINLRGELTGLPVRADILAGRAMLSQIDSMARRKGDFGFETTLSGLTYVNMVRRLRNEGFSVHLFFLWIPDVELALARIRSRVAKGGHYIPELVARRRFDRSVRNFLHRYRQGADSWILFDNSAETPQMIACKELGNLRILDARVYNTLTERYG